MAKLKASTLIEVTVAMVLISIITTLAIFIYLNTIASISSSKELVLHVKAQSLINEYISDRTFERINILDEAGCLIQIDTKDHDLFENILEVRCYVSDSLQIKEVIIKRLVYEVE